MAHLTDEQKKVTILLDKERVLFWNWNAAQFFENKSGYSIAEALNKSGFLVTQYLLMAGLVHAFPRITSEDVGKMLQIALDRGDDINQIMKLAVEAMLRAQLLGPHEPKEIVPDPKAVAEGKVEATSEAS